MKDMDKLGNQFKWKLQRHISASVDFLNPQANSLKQKSKTDNHLKWLALSTNSISFLPVFLASDATESEFSRRASSAEILAPVELDRSLRAATKQTSGEMPASPCVDTSHINPDPFRATLLWEKIVIHLERTVKAGRHTLGLRTFENCFHGSKAVDSLVVYLNTILPKTVKRAQAQVLCEKLLETGVIEEVKERQDFREKGLYRFTNNHFWEASLTTSAGSCDSDELQARLPRSRSMEVLQTECPAPKADTQEHPHFRLAIPKGYASDSTVTISTHRHRKKRKSRKLSSTSKEAEPLTCRIKLNELTLLTKNKMQSVARHLQINRTKAPACRVPNITLNHKASAPKPDPTLKGKASMRTKPIKCTATRLPQDDRQKRRYSREGYLQVREKENYCRRESVNAVAAGVSSKKLKRTCKLKERDSSFANSSKDYLNIAELSASHGPTVAINSATMNRSHSFSSRGDLPENLQVTDKISSKWIVYGFI